MTISEIRNKYTKANFHFFDADGWTLQRTSFLHEKVSNFSVCGEHIYIYL